MENTNKLLKDPRVLELLDRLYGLEDDRIYCRHDLVHFFDVARIFYILCLENSIKIKKDLVYTTGLLHDLGRSLEYEKGISHDKASVEIARDLLEITDYSQDEKEVIYSLIANHRKKSEDKVLEALFYKADKLSRDCFNCRHQSSCKWPIKNTELTY